jgi:uncharacterized membrane protein YheB (UPF0754 family)
MKSTPPPKFSHNDDSLWTLLQKYSARHWPAAEDKTADQRPLPSTRAASPALFYLQVVTYVLPVLFVLSFFWDFPGLTLIWWGYTVSLEGLLRILSVSGLIGFLTNWVAVTMLFQPRERRPLLGQGLIPAQREQVVTLLAQAISQRLINEDLIHQQIEQSGLIARARHLLLHFVHETIDDPEFRSDLKRMVTRYVDQALADPSIQAQISSLVMRHITQQTKGVSGVVLRVLQQFRAEELEEAIQTSLRTLPESLDELIDRWHPFWDTVPDKLEARAHDIEQWVSRAVLHFVQQLDVQGLLIANMSKYDEAQLESLLKHTSNEQFNYIKYLGGALGVLGGVVIWQPLPALLIFAVLGLLIWGVDEALMRRRRTRMSIITRKDGRE